ncbi:DUF4240 domain-containing protein [Micromonospora sp. NPDC049559]|uniref:DUF4240 domain-containing protein n=1 Tax=Micromonospora sp. NPDC049559 TaxID=3155923 RepID=UPI003437C51C
MRTDAFWALIDEARTGAGGDTEAIATRAAALLARRDVTEIAGWQRHLRRVLAASYRVDLWGAAYLINGGASDDGFEYFRGWLIGQGREVFARAVAEPDTLAELPPIRQAAATGEEFESERMLGIAADAYRQATAAELPPDPDPVPYPEISDDFWDFDDEEEARRHLPRLAALFTEPPPE